MLQSLPVVMYHSVHTWHNRGLVISPELFEAHCRAMAEGGWRCASLPEAEDYLLRGKPLPAKTAWLTFDDGYLDNYVYAWPILEKYGLHGTVFATLEHLENSGPARLSLHDVWEGRATMDDLPVAENPMRMHPDLGFEERADLFSSVAFWYQQGIAQGLETPPYGNARLPHGNARQARIPHSFPRRFP